MISCGSSHHAGCPGQDRPSFRGYGMNDSQMYDFHMLPSDKKVDLISGTFPAGTLSGAPKHKAMQLIEHHENISREFYGGAIGFMGFNGDFNHAIIIRSFLSKNRRLFYQAGAGIVFKSNPDSENQEVYNKIEALRKAIKIAEKIWEF